MRARRLAANVGRCDDGEGETMRASLPVAATLTTIAVLSLGACAQPSSRGLATDESGPAAAGTPTTTTSITTTPTTVTSTTPAATTQTEPNLPVPSGAPSVPTDPYPLDRVAGRISQVGSGPCYTVVNDDGVAFALVGGTDPALAAGTWVRVTFRPEAAGPASCPGKPVTIVKIEVIG
jgi:hypothetical protein